jgi:hypothetical protein
MQLSQINAAALIIAAGLSGCGEDITQQVNDFAGRTDGDSPNQLLDVNREILDLAAPPPNPERNAYFGDLHVHTEYSFDAYSFGTTASPYDAYRYARGEALTHPRGYQIQLRSPLDFYAVTDHAMFLGLVKAHTQHQCAGQYGRYQRPAARGKFCHFHPRHPRRSGRWQHR